MPILHLFLITCFLVTEASICGREECKSCVLAKEYVSHWSGDSVTVDSYLNCESVLGEDYVTVKAMKQDISGQFVKMDTDVLQNEYQKWLEEGGSEASVSCQNRTQLFICMDFFPPCEDENNYAVYPCKSACIDYYNVCDRFASPIICPVDGPDYNATKIGDGKYPLSNNALQSCFTEFQDILPSRCLATPLDCNFSPYHPECSYCICDNGYVGMNCDYCQFSSQCMAMSHVNQTCWQQPVDVLINLEQNTFNSSRSISCVSHTNGLLSTYIGNHNILIDRVDEDVVELSVFSSVDSMAPELLSCSYSDCKVLSSVDCSVYATTLNDCLYCSSVACSLNPSAQVNPFGTLFSFLDSPGIFTCDGDTCLWIHNNIFSQELLCTAGACIDDVTHPVHNWPIYIILGAFVIVLVMILVIVISTPSDNAIVTPVTREVKKTMSYARMSTHLLTPLMECDEDPHSFFMGSRTNLQHMEFAWYNVEVKNPEGKVIVNSRIGSVNNTKGLYAIVGPVGTHSRHLLRAMCGMCEEGHKATGTFYRNGVILSHEDLLRDTSYVDNPNDLCPDLTVRETIENAIVFSQPPWVSAIETEGRVDSMLADLRLVAYQHMQLKALRKDQMMILRIAIEVLTKSSLIIIDNPFDSFTPSMTINVLSYLKKTQRSGVIILLAFYQPRSMVLQTIQNIILIGRQGNLIYSGNIKQVQKYFSQFDISVPERHSDSDYLLDIISRSDDILVDRMISTYRNSEDNKLLLLSMRQIRKESHLNLQNMSFIKIDSLLSSTMAIQNVPSEQFKYYNTQMNSFSLNSKLGSRAQFSIGEQSNTSISSIYKDSPPPAVSSQRSSPNPRSGLNSQLLLHQEPTKLAHQEEWKISTKVSSLLLLKRIVRCFKRDRHYIHHHLLSALVTSLSIGLFFFQLKQDTEGIHRRYFVILMTILFIIIQSYSLKKWYDKDMTVFIRNCRCGYVSPVQYYTIVTILDSIFNRFLPSLLYSLPLIFLTGMCKTDEGFNFSKIILFIFACYVGLAFFSSFFAILHFTKNHLTYFVFLLFIALQVIPTISNLWDIKGWWSILVLLFPPVIFYRLFLLIEFRSLSFVVSLIGNSVPLTRLDGDFIIRNKGAEGFAGAVMGFIAILLYSILCNIVVFLKLRWSVTSSPLESEHVNSSSSPITTFDASSSDIRIESDDEAELLEETNLVSTRSTSRRERIQSSDMGEDAGLPI